MAIDRADPRFILGGFEPLAATQWYRSQPPETQAHIGLYRVATAMRTGWEFENVLQRGLLEYLFWFPNGRPEFRYAHHEIIEESQHTLMFQEFVNRSGLDVRGMPVEMKIGSRLVVHLSRVFPALFFLFVLGGEDPVDHLQRRHLRTGVAHPLVERIMRIHVAEEARHLSFARQYLKHVVPGLGPVRHLVLTCAAPLLFGTMGPVMVFPSRSMARQWGIPRRELRGAVRSPAGRRLLRDAVSRPRNLCHELGLTRYPGRLLWRAMGIWEDPEDAAPTDPAEPAAA